MMRDLICMNCAKRKSEKWHVVYFPMIQEGPPYWDNYDFCDDCYAMFLKLNRVRKAGKVEK